MERVQWVVTGVRREGGQVIWLRVGEDDEGRGCGGAEEMDDLQKNLSKT